MPDVVVKRLFVTPKSRKAFAFLETNPYKNGDIAWGPSVGSLHAVAIHGYSSYKTGVILEFDFSFSQPELDIKGEAQYKDGVITFNGETYAPVLDDVWAIGVTPLPDLRQPMYFCTSNAGVLVYVSSGHYDRSNDSIKLYVGNDGIASMRQIPITKVERYRDGGTVFIETAEGKFSAPSPFAGNHILDKTKKWGNIPLVDVSPELFVFHEKSDGLTIERV